MFLFQAPQIDSCSTYLHIFVADSVKAVLTRVQQEKNTPYGRQGELNRPSDATSNTASSGLCIDPKDVLIFEFLLGCGACPYLRYNPVGDTLVHFMVRWGDLTLPFLAAIIRDPLIYDQEKFHLENIEGTLH